MPFPFPDPDPQRAAQMRTARSETAATAQADERTEVPALARWELRHTRGMTGRSRLMTITAKALDEDAAIRVGELMGAARFTELPGQMGQAMLDGDSYELTAGDATWSHTVRWTNRSATAELSRLFRALEALGTWIPQD
ncbi:MAG: protealysin inhibitor emfourin [Thermoleophilia bacterium]